MLLFLLLAASAASGEKLEQSVGITEVQAHHGEVFKLVLDSSLLSSSANFRPTDGVRFSPSIRDAPDLPSWLSYGYSAERRSGVVYGVPPQHVSQFRLEVIATNQRTYETSRQEFVVIVHDNADLPRHEVQMKINNMNPVDLFFDSNLERLREIFQEVLWPAAGADLRLTWLEVPDSAAVAPLPGRRAGALLRLAAAAPFSRALRHLQREVRSLWARVPCPRDFKRSSFERHFRQRGFMMDWCQFKLYEFGELALPSETVPSTLPPPPPTAPPLLDVVVLPLRAAAPAASYTRDFLTTIGIPLLVALVLCSILTCIMCCQGEHLRRPAEIQMVQYPGGGSSLPRSGQSTLRRSCLRDVSPRLAEQSETEPARREHPLLRDVSPRLTPYRDGLSPVGSGPSTPESGGFSQHGLPPPPYPTSRRS